VTQGFWKAVMGTTPWSGQNRVKDELGYPAVYVNWYEANEFCRKLTERERRSERLSIDWKYDLPTQAQWEYACRAGTQTKYSFGDDTKRLLDHAWFKLNAEHIGQHYAHAVGAKSANPWGLHDMHGNVHEWCRDSHRDRLLGGIDPEVTAKDTDRWVYRGGSWNNWDFRCQSGARIGGFHLSRDPSVGFRVAQVPLVHSVKKPTSEAKIESQDRKPVRSQRYRSRAEAEDGSVPFIVRVVLAAHAVATAFHQRCLCRQAVVYLDPPLGVTVAAESNWASPHENAHVDQSDMALRLNRLVPRRFSPANNSIAIRANHDLTH
jgi:hypothetical protein